MQPLMVESNFSGSKVHIVVVWFASRMWFHCVWKSKLKRQSKSTQQNLSTLKVLHAWQNEFLLVSIIDVFYKEVCLHCMNDLHSESSD